MSDKTYSFIVELSSAVHYKNIKALADLLNHAVMGAVNEQDEEGNTVLMCAAHIKNNIGIVSLLLTFPGIDVNLANNRGDTALITAIRRGRLGAAKLLLAFPGIDVNKQTIDGTTALLAACGFIQATERHHTPPQIVKMLLAFPNINVNAHCQRGDRALIAAARGEYLETVELLLACPHIQPNAITKYGYSALDLSCNPHIKALFVAHVTRPAWPRLITATRSHCFLAAASQGNTQAIGDYLKDATAADVNYQDANGSTALLNAIYHEYTDVALMLLAHPNIDVNLTHKNGQSPLLVAACGQVQVVKTLLSRPNLNVNLQDENGQTALIKAILRRQTKIVKLLLACPAIDAQLAQKNGYSPLMLAAGMEKNIVEPLLAVPGVNVNWQDDEGSTALMTAVRYKNLAHLQSLLACPILQGDLQDKEGHTALILACMDGSYQFAKLLLASQRMDQTVLELTKNRKIKKLLRDYGAEPRKSKKKATPSTVCTRAPQPLNTVAETASASASDDTMANNTPTVAAFEDDAISIASTSTFLSTDSTESSSTAGSDSTASSNAQSIHPSESATSSNPPKTITCETPIVTAPAMTTAVAASPCGATAPATATTATATSGLLSTQPRSWLAARLLLGGMSEPLVQDCEQKLVYTEGFDNVGDFAECPCTEINREYLISIGITGLGTQRQVLRLHNELHNAYKQQQATPVLTAPPAAAAITMAHENAISPITDHKSANSKTPVNNQMHSEGMSNHKRSHTEAFVGDTAASDHMFVPSNTYKI